jgi:hypothetical protein
MMRLNVKKISLAAARRRSEERIDLLAMNDAVNPFAANVIAYSRSSIIAFSFAAPLRRCERYSGAG